MSVPEFSEKEIELINLLKEKGFCPETQELCGAWEDAEKSKPEWGEIKNTTENNARLFLQAELDLKKVKMLNGAHMPIEDLEEALSAVYQQIDAMVRTGIDCQDLQDEYFKLAEQVDINYS